MQDMNLSKLRREELIGLCEALKAKSPEDAVGINGIIQFIRDQKYGLSFEKHREQVDSDLLTKIPIFVEDEDKKISLLPSDNGPSPYNFLLEGDNLHSLKLLEKTHKGAIDVIYIDPPYNTGNEFVYNDRIVGKDDGYRHSKWLSFMSERLKIAQALLKPDGIIFISINDVEGAPLKMLCDEIFDENNFVGQLTWESTTQPTNAGSARFSLQKKVESIYCYVKDKTKRKGFLLREMESGLKYPHVGKHGVCRFEIIEKSDAGTYRRDSMKFPILGQYPREGKRWQIGEETARELEMAGRLEIVDGIVKKAVYPEDEIDKKKFEPFWSHFKADAVGTAQTGKEELNNVFGQSVGFDTVKPIKLIKELLSHFSNDVLVLDFFAGSGTTGQAVLELNKDGGNRKFILCTNNENNICEDITYGRLKTVITGIRSDGSKYSDGITANLKYFKAEMIERSDEDLDEKLLDASMPLIELENFEDIEDENSSVFIAYSDEDLDDFEGQFNATTNRIKTIYVAEDVCPSESQERLFELNEIKVKTIPSNYFREI